MNRSPILAAVLLCAAGSSSSIAQDTATSAQSAASAKEFVEKAGTSGLAEVEMGELGAQKATNGQVKAFAKRMVADHKKANEELETVIKGKGLQSKGLQIPSSRSDVHKTNSTAGTNQPISRMRARISIANTWSRWSRTTRPMSNCSRPLPTMRNSIPTCVAMQRGYCLRCETT